MAPLCMAFNLTQSVTGTMQQKVHSLDLVLSFGFRLWVSEIFDPCISDHFTVSFSVTHPYSQVKPCAPEHLVQTINSSTVSHFSAAFGSSVLRVKDENGHLSPDEFEFESVFNSTCTDLLDAVAPFRTKRSKPMTERWLNETTRALRQAERKYKKDHLQISLEILRNSLLEYQSC